MTKHAVYHCSPERHIEALSEPMPPYHKEDVTKIRAFCDLTHLRLLSIHLTIKVRGYSVRQHALKCKLKDECPEPSRSFPYFLSFPQRFIRHGLTNRRLRELLLAEL